LRARQANNQPDRPKLLKEKQKTYASYVVKTNAHSSFRLHTAHKTQWIMKKEETASFVVRFTQKVFNNKSGEPEVQWRGNIRHVQGGDEKRFSEFEEVAQFIQTKLADLTIIAMEDKTPEEQKGILSKSFDLWKKMAGEAPKLVMDTIKDPKKQIANVQTQLAETAGAIKDKIEDSLEIDEWRGPSKSDFNDMMQQMRSLAKQVETLSDKVDKLS